MASEIRRHTCKRCDHNWVPRDSGEPRVCPKCKSPYWNRPRRSDAIAEIRKIIIHG